jgi:hypothetical protein
MTRTIAMKGLVAVEHAQSDGSFVAHVPDSPRPPPLHAGDRLRARLEIADDAWVYAVSAIRKADFWQLGAWGPGEGAAAGARVLWPGGRVLTADEATMTALLVIGSTEELPWARDLTRESCAHLLGKMPPDPPATVCDHLYGLFWRIPPGVRGLVLPETGVLEDGGVKLPAIAVAHSGTTYTALEWQFKPKK